MFQKTPLLPSVWAEDIFGRELAASLCNKVGEKCNAEMLMKNILSVMAMMV